MAGVFDDDDDVFDETPGSFLVFFSLSFFFPWAWGIGKHIRESDYLRTYLPTYLPVQLLNHRLSFICLSTLPSNSARDRFVQSLAW